MIAGMSEYEAAAIIANASVVVGKRRALELMTAALLESMGEFQVTVDANTIDLPKPFFVIATQNPIEMDGTFPLPEAQLDRFLMKIDLGYPDRDEELEIMDRFLKDDPLVELVPVTRGQAIPPRAPGTDERFSFWNSPSAGEVDLIVEQFTFKGMRVLPWRTRL
jgi:MoxR-like ATPase